MKNELLKVVYNDDTYYIIKNWYKDTWHGIKRLNGIIVYYSLSSGVNNIGELGHFSLHKKAIKVDEKELDKIMVECL